MNYMLYYNIIQYNPHLAAVPIGAMAQVVPPSLQSFSDGLLLQYCCPERGRDGGKCMSETGGKRGRAGTGVGG